MFELVLFFDFIDAVPEIEKLSCSFQWNGSYILRIQSKADISTIKLCIAKSIHLQYSTELCGSAQLLIACIIISNVARRF
jgi:hypothetical protein